MARCQTTLRAVDIVDKCRNGELGASRKGLSRNTRTLAAFGGIIRLQAMGIADVDCTAAVRADRIDLNGFPNGTKTRPYVHATSCNS